MYIVTGGKEMFCEKCGTQIQEGMRFCGACGAPVSGAPVPNNRANMNGQPNQTGNGIGSFIDKVGKKKLGIIAGGIVAAIIIFFAFNAIFGKRSPEDVVDKYISAMEKFDRVEALDLVNSDLLEDVAKSEGMTVSEIMDDARSESERQQSKGIEIKVQKYDIIETMNYDEEDVAEYNRRLVSNYGTDIKVDEVITYRVKLEYTRNGISETDTEKVTVVKIGSNWYLDVNEF